MKFKTGTSLVLLPCLSGGVPKIGFREHFLWQAFRGDGHTRPQNMGNEVDPG